MVVKVKKDTVETVEEQQKRAGDRREAVDGTLENVQGEPRQTNDLAAKLQEAEKKAAENYDKYLRVAAELENYRKRMAREKAEAIRYGNENLIRDILPLVDGMDRAMEQACSSKNFEAFQEGLKLLREQLLGCLVKHGVEQICAEGRDFDPHVHEALLEVDSTDHQNSQVVDEFEKGYLLNGRLLRPAKVSVCKRPSSGGDRQDGCEQGDNN